MTKDMFEITIWGCRGSYPKPGKDTIVYGGNTTCYVVRINGAILVFDAGTGIIGFGHKLVSEMKKGDKPLQINLFFSHIHHDHIEGFPFFNPAYLHTTHINIFGACTYSTSLVDILSRSMLPPYFPVEFSETHAVKNVREIADADTMIFSSEDGTLKGVYQCSGTVKKTADDIEVKVHHGYAHPKGGINIYSVNWHGKKFVFATDTEGYIGGDQRLIRFSKDADILVHDAQFTAESYADERFPKQGWGHSTIEMAVAVAQKAGVKKLVITHHDPNDTDTIVTEKEQYAQSLFPDAECAQEGKTYVL